MSIVCEITVQDGTKGEELEVRWREDGGAFRPYTLNGQDTRLFRKEAAEARRLLRNLSSLHANGADPKQITACVQEIAEAGGDLFGRLFSSTPRTDAEEIKRWLQTQPSDPPPILEISFADESRPFFVPWNIIYEGDVEATFADPKGADRENFRGFWGIRYTLTGGLQASPLRRRPLPRDSKALVVYCPQVAGPLEWDPREEFGLFSQRVEFVCSVEDLKRRLVKGRPPIIYWLSHAQPDALYLDGEPVRLSDLDKWLMRGSNAADQPAVFRGLAILNACGTATNAELTSYLETFQRYEYSGILATEAEVLNTFAVPYGQELLRSLLQGALVGPRTRELRSVPEHLPLSLLYGTYCPPTFRIDVPSIQNQRVSSNLWSFHQGAQLRCFLWLPQRSLPRN